MQVSYMMKFLGLQNKMKKTKIIITIDSEYSSHKKDIGIFGEIGGVEYGIPKFIEIFDRYNVKATFFIDVYANKMQYRQRFMDLFMKTKSIGHDLQLHTHPDGMFDVNRGYMAKYTLEEQIEIIRRGVDIFKELFSVTPIAHRAGDWGANFDTLEALKMNSLVIDSSFFHAWPCCKLESGILAGNRLEVCQDILEIPPTTFNCTGLGIFNTSRLLSTDGNSIEEVRYVLKKMQAMGVPVINLVYHSFSFLRWNKDRACYSPNLLRLQKFEYLLKELKLDDSVEVLTITDVYDNYMKDKAKYILDNSQCSVSTGIGYFLLRCKERIMWQ